MKTRSINIVLALCFVAAVGYAADPNMGTWKLNESKSKFSPGTGKNPVVIYAPEGENVKITVDGVDADGKPTHNEWTGTFDGKDYPVIGDPFSDTRSYKVVDANTLHATGKKDGKVTVEIHIVVSPDGKVRTVTSNGTDSKGNKFTNIAVYDKQ